MLDRSAVITASLRLHKASKNHRAAQHIFEYGDYEAANDRAFFCMFHAARALLAYENIAYAISDGPKKTDTIIQEFHELYVKQRFHDPRLTETFMDARKIRNEELYDRSFTSGKEITEQNIRNAGYFLETARDISKWRVAFEYEQPGTD